MSGRLAAMVKVLYWFTGIWSLPESLFVLQDSRSANMRLLTSGAGYQPGDPIEGHAHAWNATLLDGEYLLIDSTWGAGNVNNMRFEHRFTPFYFLVSPKRMIYSHFPTQPEYQYLDPPLEKDTCRYLPYVKSGFFDSGLSFPRYTGCVIEVEGDAFWIDIEQELTEKNARKYLAVSLTWKGQKIEAFVQKLFELGPKGGLIHRIRCAAPSAGEGYLRVFVLEGTGVSVMNTGGEKRRDFCDN
jgi:hypothetical protein